MKLKIMLLLVAITMCFVGCAKDEPEDTNSIIGKWSTANSEEIYYEFRTDGSYSFRNYSNYPYIVGSDGIYRITGPNIMILTCYGYFSEHIDFLIEKDEKGEYLLIGLFKLYRIE